MGHAELRRPAADDLGITPVFVRYNTGRHVSENGASLAALLDELVAGWPVQVERIAIVGHSMGGLVARSACHHGGDWSDRVSHVISLGTPHMGAPLEQAVHALSAALHLAPETRPFARFLRRRSAGIRDLRRGSLVDEDWREQDPDALRAKALHRGSAVRRRHALLRRRDDHGPARAPVGRLLGDALVLDAERLGPQPQPPDRLRRRVRDDPRRDTPSGPAQPPRGLRATARLARLTALGSMSYTGV